MHLLLLLIESNDTKCRQPENKQENKQTNKQTIHKKPLITYQRSFDERVFARFF